jgi:uncharacterized protein (DUF427 family)
MNKAPGHQKWPDHKIKETHIPGKMAVEVDGKTIAESRDVILVEEDQNPPRYYFPRKDVDMTNLQPTITTTQCPFKGTAHYFNLMGEDLELKDAVWTYESPFDEHKNLKNRIAFDADKFHIIHIKSLKAA